MTGLPAFAAALRPSEGWHPGPFGSKIFFGTGRVLRTSTGARPARPERRGQTADAPIWATPTLASANDTREAAGNT